MITAVTIRKITLLCVGLCVTTSYGWTTTSTSTAAVNSRSAAARTASGRNPNLLPCPHSSTSLRVLTKDEETTEKYGLEAGLLEAAKGKDGESAKSLLKKYGIAYLVTSIPLALLSFSICYVMVDNGVDVTSMLDGIGITSSDMADKAGTFAIAYAAHKALSPVRFPPTVLLTPLVAKFIGKEPESAVEE